MKLKVAKCSFNELEDILNKIGYYNILKILVDGTEYTIIYKDIYASKEILNG